MKRYILIFLFLTLITSLYGEGTKLIKNPYGVCAHVSRAWKDAPYMKEEFKLLNKAGINYVRVDFDWKVIQPRKGVWNFDHIDKVMAQAKKDNLHILPILGCDIPWANPPYKHLNDWGVYVNKVASRYKDQIRYWEVWNEQNGSLFWGEKPDAKNYTILLKRAYQEIKKVDSDLQVGFGGTAGIPLRFIEAALDEEAGKYFDFFNIHPYTKGSPELMIHKIKALRKLFSFYDIEKKPIWITEFGYPTAPPDLFPKVLPVVFNEIGIVPEKVDIAVIRDPEYGMDVCVSQSPEFMSVKFKNVNEIRFDQIKDIDVKNCPVLIPSNTEAFPAKFVPQLVDYVKRGGTLFLPGGLPLYYDLLAWDKDFPDNGLENSGFWVIQKNAKYMKPLHISWETWWVKKGVPRSVRWQKTADKFSDRIKLEQQSFGKPIAGFSLAHRPPPPARFLGKDNMKPGDEFVSFIDAGTGNYKGSIFALYKLNSDLKGNVIVYPGKAEGAGSETRVAKMLPRSYLTAMGKGVDKIFWYRLRASEREEQKYNPQEENLGIVHADLSPKSAYYSYKTLVGLCPPGSTRPVLSTSSRNNIWTANWTRPDGIKVWALWTQMQSEYVFLKIKGKVESAKDYLGKDISISEERMRLANGIVYLIGPEEIKLKKL